MKTAIKILTLPSLKTVCAGQSVQSGGSGSVPSPPELLCALCANAVG